MIRPVLLSCLSHWHGKWNGGGREDPIKALPLPLNQSLPKTSAHDERKHVTGGFRGGWYWSADVQLQKKPISPLLITNPTHYLKLMQGGGVFSIVSGTRQSGFSCCCFFEGPSLTSHSTTKIQLRFQRIQCHQVISHFSNYNYLIIYSLQTILTLCSHTETSVQTKSFSQPTDFLSN